MCWCSGYSSECIFPPVNVSRTYFSHSSAKKGSLALPEEISTGCGNVTTGTHLVMLGLTGVLQLGVKWGKRKDTPWVKATFPDGPTTKPPVSKDTCTTYGKHQISAHQTDSWQLIPLSLCTRVTTPMDKEGHQWVSFHYQIDIISLPTKKSTQSVSSWYCNQLRPC